MIIVVVLIVGSALAGLALIIGVTALAVFKRKPDRPRRVGDRVADEEIAREHEQDGSGRESVNDSNTEISFRLNREDSVHQEANFNLSADIQAIQPPPYSENPLKIKITRKLRQEAKQKYGIDSENCLNIAIFGERGVGKSLLINAILGDDKAEVSTEECSKEPRPYPWRTFGRFILENNETSENLAQSASFNPIDFPESEFMIHVIDLPGLNTVNQPVKEYFRQNFLFLYDIIIVAIEHVFTESDLAIIRQCLLYEELRSSIIIVRTKADQLIKNKIKDEMRKKNEIDFQRAMDLVKIGTQNHLREALASLHLEHPFPCFILSSYQLRESIYHNYLQSMEDQELLPCERKYYFDIDEKAFIEQVFAYFRVRYN